MPDEVVAAAEDSEQADRQDSLDHALGQYERDAVRLARADPSYFCEYVFGWKNQPCHDEWHQLCTEHDRLVIFAPVEHGKSCQISMGRTPWEIGKNVNIRSANISNTSTQAQKFLGVIRQTIQYNERYHKVFPHVRPERRRGRVQAWQDSHIVIERTDLTNKDYTVQAVGVLGNIMGARLDHVVLDDILDFENTLTAAQRARMIQWLISTVMSRMTARSRLWGIGNAWHDEDAMHWMAQNPRFKAAFYDAEDDLWPELIVMPSGEVCGWPKARRNERKREVGLVEYNRSMRNIAATTGGSDDFKRADIEACMELAEKDGEHLVGEYNGSWLVYVGVDLSVSKKMTAAETAFFILGLDPIHVKHVLNIIAGRMSLLDIVRNFVLIQERFRPVVFMVENNAAQDYILQFLRGADDIFQAMLMDGGLTPDANTLQSTKRLRTIAHRIRLQAFTTGANKADPILGIRAMGVDFATRKWRIPKHRQTEEWFKEMLRYTPGEHTGDRLMASWFATHACGVKRRGKLRATSLEAA